ncbi:MAG: MgtC/SapB family protein [Tissierellia bacterium]|nr:MgtC/SapB family protein [Tissierellia bacterium]
MIARWEVAIRLVSATVIGGLIGMEREVSNRPAGLRTHILVTLGSTLVMLISMDGFHSMGSNIKAGDPARLAAQVISGIGFLGAGTIMRTESSIRGLTTAASLWVCAGIGLAIGSGYYMGGLLTSGIVLITLMSLRVMEKKVIGSRYRMLEIIGSGRPGLIGDIGTLMGEHRVRIRDISIMGESEAELGEGMGNPTLEIHFMVRLPIGFRYDEFLLELGSIRGVNESRFQANI